MSPKGQKNKKKEESKLKEKGAFMHNLNEQAYTVLDNLLEGFQIIDFDWHYVYVNETVAKQGKQTKKSLVGHTMMEIYPGIENTELFAVLQDCMENRVTRQMENEFVYPDGTRGWFELRNLYSFN